MPKIRTLFCLVDIKKHSFLISCVFSELAQSKHLVYGTDSDDVRSGQELCHGCHSNGTHQDQVQQWKPCHDNRSNDKRLQRDYAKKPDISNRIITTCITLDQQTFTLNKSVILLQMNIFDQQTFTLNKSVILLKMNIFVQQTFTLNKSVILLKINRLSPWTSQ